MTRITDRPYILFDAGGTLVYPDPEPMGSVCAAYGYRIDREAVFRSLFRTIYSLDLSLREPTGTAPDDFLAALLVHAGVAAGHAEKLAQKIVTAAGGLGPLWTHPLPWTHVALQRLQAAGYRMSVISNAAGTARRQIQEAGLHPYFEHTFDSEEVGATKPDRRIFHFALAELGIDPRSCLYVGDVVMVDVLGANRANIPAVHLDPLGLYAAWPGRHVRGLIDFVGALLHGTLNPADPALRPFPGEPTGKV